MELLKKGKLIKEWGVVYIGLKRNWLTSNQVLNYCKDGKIVCDNDRIVLLYLALDESMFEFLELIKQFIIEDGQPPILWNEDSNNEDQNVVPKRYLYFWELEFLLRIVNSNYDRKSKLCQVAAIHEDFGYPSSWNGFIYYMPASSNDEIIGIEGLYSNLLDFIDKKINDIP